MAIVYFDRITVFGVPYHWTSSKNGAHMGFVDLYLRCTYEPQYGTPNTAKRSKCVQPNNLRFLHGTVTFALVLAVRT